MEIKKETQRLSEIHVRQHFLVANKLPLRLYRELGNGAVESSAFTLQTGIFEKNVLVTSS